MSKVLKSVSWVLFLTVMLLGVPKIAGSLRMFLTMESLILTGLLHGYLSII